MLAAVAAVGFAGAYLTPAGAALAEADPVPVETSTVYTVAAAGAQSIQVTLDSTGVELDRGTYDIYVKPKPKPKPQPVAATSTAPRTGWAPPAVTPDPGSAQAITYDMVMARGWGDAEFSCLVALWNRESGWRVNAHNRSSGAYGIPQSLPGNKMAAAGADWETNPATQITWGLGYIGARYGTPCGAWGHSQARGWY